MPEMLGPRRPPRRSIDANRWRNFNATYQGSGNATYDALMERAAAAEQAGFLQQVIARCVSRR